MILPQGHLPYIFSYFLFYLKLAKFNAGISVQKLQALDIERLTQTISKTLENPVEREVIHPPLQVCLALKLLNLA